MKRLCLALVSAGLLVHPGCGGSSSGVGAITSPADRQRYLQDLQEFPDYENEPVTLAEFSYSGTGDPNLTELRQTYRLDEVAGAGDELSRIRNLMLWVHGLLRHEGSADNPQPQNALNIIKVCTTGNRGVNCRMLATVLNEVYLAMGFASRHITCMPRGESFSDCHVINVVYARTQGRWVYMDPTFAAYFRDEGGAYLGIDEVRRRFVADNPPVLAQGVNHNGTPTATSEYETYMMKNLFRFSCPIASAFGYESLDADKTFVFLNPRSYNPHGQRTSSTDTAGHTVTNYYVSNPGVFWAAPSAD